MKLNIIIDIDSDRTRLDTMVSNVYPSCSRSCAALLINKGQVLVNQTIKKPGYRVKTGDAITGTIPKRKTEPCIRPQHINLDILFEDSDILVINKQAGLVVHPTPVNLADTLVNALLYHDPEIQKTSQDQFRSGIVHRLDKDTSGLMVVAKTAHALDFLQKEFKHRRVEKRYLALIHGRMPEQKGQINLPIGRHPVNRKILTIRPDDGKEAITLWSVQKEFTDASLVEVLLKTGRTHQIRVHFYAMDHPLIGDQVYQPRRFRKKKSVAPRQMLHSFFLGFRHPYSEKRMEFCIAPPEDFLWVQARLEQKSL
ncbi:MAG: RluA family pseudouridine synthase [Pseudomonadota bacterium]